MSNKLNNFRQEVLKGTKLINVDLSCCNLDEFPEELFLMAPNLESLNLSGTFYDFDNSIICLEYVK